MDQFDIQRQWDNAAQDGVDEAMDKLDENKDKAEERRKRMVRLDDGHFFDAENRHVYAKDGESYVRLVHDASDEMIASDKIEEEARRKGYTPVEGRLFWDAASKDLYIKNGEHYVLMRSGKAKPVSPA